MFIIVEPNKWEHIKTGEYIKYTYVRDGKPKEVHGYIRSNPYTYIDKKTRKESERHFKVGLSMNSDKTWLVRYSVINTLKKKIDVEFQQIKEVLTHKSKKINELEKANKEMLEKLEEYEKEKQSIYKVLEHKSNKITELNNEVKKIKNKIK